MDSQTLAGIGLLMIIPGIFVWGPLLMWYCVKQDMKKDQIQGDKNEAENRLRIEEELKKPFYRIVFQTNDGTSLKTDSIAPAWDEGAIRSKRWFWLNTAKMEANKLLKFSYERGYFRDDNNNTYPTCNILTAKIEEQSGT